jgi:hypothetical protein
MGSRAGMNVVAKRKLLALAENRTPVPQVEVGSTNRACQLSTVNLNEIDWSGLTACRPRTSR